MLTLARLVWSRSSLATAKEPSGWLPDQSTTTPSRCRFGIARMKRSERAGSLTICLAPASTRAALVPLSAISRKRLDPARVANSTCPANTCTSELPSCFTSTPNSVPRSVTVAVGVRMTKGLGIRDWGLEDS